MNDGSPAGLFFRPASPADVAAMRQLERQTPSAAHWPRQRYESIFAGIWDQTQIRRFAWVVEHERDAARSKISTEVSEQLLGFLVAHQVDREWELENIVVAQALWRTGIGARLLEEFIAHVRLQHGTSILLEVREFNQVAQALYTKIGFVEVGLRKNYYSNPSESAVIYQLILRQEP